MLLEYFQLGEISLLNSLANSLPIKSYASYSYSEPADSSMCCIISEMLIGSLQNEHLTMFLMQKL